MDFKKKLKIRLYLAISYMFLGVVMIIVSNLVTPRSEYFSAYGFALFCVGIARIRHYFKINKSEESIRKREIAESDERNIYLVNKARSMTFVISVLAACVAVIVLQILNFREYAVVLSWIVCGLVLVYWICYFIVRKKS